MVASWNSVSFIDIVGWHVNTMREGLLHPMKESITCTTSVESITNEKNKRCRTARRIFCRLLSPSRKDGLEVPDNRDTPVPPLHGLTRSKSRSLAGWALASPTAASSRHILGSPLLRSVAVFAVSAVPSFHLANRSWAVLE